VPAVALAKAGVFSLAASAGKPTTFFYAFDFSISRSSASKYPTTFFAIRPIEHRIARAIAAGLKCI